jgi:hypothetical protein
MRRYQRKAPSPLTSESTPPIAIASRIPTVEARAPINRPPIGIDAEKTVV